MFEQVIDRRLAGKNKSIGNRERFLRRHKEQIRKAVKRVVDGRRIHDIEQGEDIRIPKRDMAEPYFGHGPGGRREVVHPGNPDHLRGDRIARPDGDGPGGSGKSPASDSGEDDDDFVFHLTKEEFMQVFFDDLALPNLACTALAQVPEFKTHRAGFTSDGTPNSLHIVRSMRAAIGRRLAVGGAARRELRWAQHELALIETYPRPNPFAHEILRLRREIPALRARLGRIAFLDPIDLRFRSRVRVPVPVAKAVMFCLMDVSSSMDESRKDLAKRFFILLHLFLTRHYEKIEIVFIRHHTQAQEVGEQDFFHSTETGGTIVSGALVLMEEIARARYPTSEWNLYGAQAGDGDNWQHDSGLCRELLAGKILPLCRYFAYLQVADAEQSLWVEYATLVAENKTLAIRKVSEATQIYPVFRELFKKEGDSP